MQEAEDAAVCDAPRVDGDARTRFKKGPLINYADHRLAVRAIKIVADGALGSRGAALLAPMRTSRRIPD
jgi:predicted amidohydrolase YtcJ